ncbi:hypothetical protein GRAN_2007 [Granulicella sibirica]|uniref:Uncharacterized protein n=1 Tax=Granulicella sibirica TaxID=2479048 RepID=A0A4Q0T5L5_9BACT|nr:hypothetical protein GRAN_2007 [Granulicella sibirica]
MVAGGYVSTNGSGWFLWPRGFWVLALILFVLFLLRRRRR